MLNVLEMVSCGGITIDAIIPALVHLAVLAIKVFVPIILIVFGMMDLAKAVMANEEKAMREAQSRFIKRLLYAGTLQCNSRISLLLKLLNDKRISMVEYYNHEHTMVECSSSGITYVSNKEVINDIESSNRDIMKLKKSLGLEEK